MKPAIYKKWISCKCRSVRFGSQSATYKKWLSCKWRSGNVRGNTCAEQPLYHYAAGWYLVAGNVAFRVACLVGFRVAYVVDAWSGSSMLDVAGFGFLVAVAEGDGEKP